MDEKNQNRFVRFIIRVILICGIGGLLYWGQGYMQRASKEDTQEAPVSSSEQSGSDILPTLRKPAIYLYPETDTEVDVTLDFENGGITHSVPEYDDGWHVLVHSDGSIDNLRDNTVDYPYLFWEGESDIDFDTSHGWCVKKSELRDLLADVLPKYGLNSRETHDFEIYWLPILEDIDNDYVCVSFDTKSYEEAVTLNVTPEPDMMIRLYMVARGSDAYVDMQKPDIVTANRSGFTVVEWGGSIVL